MNGKVSMILVIVFSLFCLFGRNMLRINSVTITENFSDYYEYHKNQILLLAESNIALGKLNFI